MPPLPIYLPMSLARCLYLSISLSVSVYRFGAAIHLLPLCSVGASSTFARGGVTCRSCPHSEGRRSREKLRKLTGAKEEKKNWGPSLQPSQQELLKKKKKSNEKKRERERHQAFSVSTSNTRLFPKISGVLSSPVTPFPLLAR